MFLKPARSTSSIFRFSSFIRSKYTLPDLPYDYNALEPVISAEIMQIHHQKHHATYVSNLNMALEKAEEARVKEDLNSLVLLQSQINFNGGGNINHSIFWKNLCPKKDAHGQPQGRLAEAINSSFGSFDAFKNYFIANTASVQGSGWGWLGFNPVSNQVQFATTLNQNTLQSTTGLIPLLGIDVWEHAYYLQYKNVRPDYLKAIWSIINWDDVAQRYHEASPASKK